MKIAVVGAGMAGLVLARGLYADDQAVQVFDKARAPAGRMTTKQTNAGPVDIGAQYFTARSPAFAGAVQAWVERGLCAPWDFQPVKALAEGGWKDSADSTVRFAGVGGMSTILKAMAREVPLMMSTHIARVIRTSSGYQLLDREQQVIWSGDRVVLTVPLEQVRGLLTETLIPAGLPESLHHPCWSVTLQTNGFGHPECQGIFGVGPVTWVSRQTAKPGCKPIHCNTDVWVVHLAPDESAQLTRDNRDGALVTAREWLQRLLSWDVLPEPVHTHFWRYANHTPEKFQTPFFTTEDDSLAIAGSWCAGGKVEGAFESASALVAHWSR